MKLLKRKIIIVLIFVILILIETVSLAFYQTVTIEENNKKQAMEIMTTEEGVLTPEEQETLNLINDYRKQNGLEELKAISKLQQVAKLKAQDIVDYEYFSHTSPNLGTPFEMLKQNEIDYTMAGENLAGNISPEKAVEAWINFPSHKENILEKFEYTGICVVESPIYGKVFVQLFMRIDE